MPNDKLSICDNKKLNLLTKLLQDQAGQFGFITFSPDELSISEDSYRPEKEGHEIGFETSLLALASVEKTSHPELLIFDEPR